MRFSFDCSAIVLGHIVIATEPVAEMPDSDSDQESQNTDNSRELHARSTPEDIKSATSPEEEQQSPREKPPWPEDSGGNVTSSQNAPDNNFSQAFNLKHLIYFENASQNNGWVIVNYSIDPLGLDDKDLLSTDCGTL